MAVTDWKVQARNTCFIWYIIPNLWIKKVTV